MTTDDLRQFVSANTSPLHNLALSLTGSRADADDLVQITMEKMARAWRRPIDQPAAYARKVLIRSYISERRRARWHRERSAAAEDLDRSGDSTSSVEDRLVLVEALAGLPRRQREAVILRYLEDLPVKEVAELMGCSEGNVKRCAYEGLQALRTALDPGQRPEHHIPTKGGAR